MVEPRIAAALCQGHIVDFADETGVFIRCCSRLLLRKKELGQKCTQQEKEGEEGHLFAHWSTFFVANR
jgi:hypothetical protein